MALLVGVQATAADQVLDRVVAQVDGQVITLSDLRFEARVALVDRGGTPLESVPLDQAALLSALDLAIAQRAAGAEADRLGSLQLDPADIDARVKAFEGHFSGPTALEAFLRAQGADRAQLAEVLARGLRAERALDARVRLRAQVSEADVRRAWEAAGSKGSFEQARGAIREELVRERYQAAAREELAKLRAAAQVRIVARPADLAEAR
ncbi:MAG TPA: hypothetical protein VK454_06640 [Myxococcaceae bacterium]|nr:hypothetical protein [Myxococcaceae bacterium]